MAKIVSVGVILKETIVSVPHIPIQYSRISFLPNSIFCGVGGHSFNMSLAMQYLGDEVTLFSMIGEKENPATLEPADIPVSLTKMELEKNLSATPSAVVLFDDEMRQQRIDDFKDAAEHQINIEKFKTEIKDADLVLLSNASFCVELAEIAKEAGKKIAINMRTNLPDEREFNTKLMELCDIFYFSDTFLKEKAYDFTKKMAEKYDPEIIVTGSGSRGHLLYTREGKRFLEYKPVKTLDIVNTVGAGNALIGSFLHFYLKDGNPLKAIKKANIFASYKIGFTGSSYGFISEEEIERWEKLIFRN